MYNMDNLPSHHLPLRLVIVLSICVGGLVAHFFAESISPAVQVQTNTFEMVGHGGYFDHAYDNDEDSFVIPCLFEAENPHTIIHIALPDSLDFLSFSASPVFPPPKAS
jgi:hypothetical protein